MAGPTNSNPVSASFTGGSPGVPTYSWAFNGASTPATPVSFINPAAASSQIVQFANVPAAAPGNSSSYTVTVRVTITDSQSHTSSQDQLVQVQKNGPPVPPGPPPGP